VADDNITILALLRLSLPTTNVFLIFASLTRGGTCPWQPPDRRAPRASLVERVES
jgi:hypothetical protein